jgi:hypothetical protein
MKKLLAMGALAVALLAVSQQQASAWKNVKFGCGLNWEWSSGGNCFGWGLWRSGQPPGPESFGYPGHGPYGNGFAPMPGGYGMPGYGMPGYGMPNGYGMEHGSPMPGVGPGGDFTLPPPRPADAQTMRYFPPYDGAYYVPVNWYR